MRKFLWILLGIAGLSLLILLFSYINRDRMMDRMMEAAMDQALPLLEYLEDMDGIRVFTLGTASPLPNPTNQTGTAVFAGGKFFLFDVGNGVIKEAEGLNLPIAFLSGVFISHYHTDHYIELPNAINRSWQMGREQPLDVYGPPGLDSIMIGINAFLKIENQHRVAHHGHEVMNPNIAGAKVNIINTDQQGSTVVYNDGKVTITAFEVCHEPVTPSYGFKIDYKGKSVVISGDTKEDCPNVLKFAQDADILFHEVMLKDMFLKASEINKEAGQERVSKIAFDITDYHTSPEDVGKTAIAANVKKLVLHHFAPVPSNIILRRRYRQAIKKNYKGPLSLAKDGDEYYVDCIEK